MDDLDILRDENFDPTIVPDKWYYFEVMDRSHMLMSHVSEAYCNHPGLDEVHARKAQAALNIIMEIYQYAGRKVNEECDDTDSP